MNDLVSLPVGYVRRLSAIDYEEWPREDRIAWNFATLVFVLFIVLFGPYHRVGLSSIRLVATQAAIWGFVGILVGGAINAKLDARRRRGSE